jgi:hypothetical protein
MFTKIFLDSSLQRFFLIQSTVHVLVINDVNREESAIDLFLKPTLIANSSTKVKQHLLYEKNQLV